jgi:hypothetical protein
MAAEMLQHLSHGAEAIRATVEVVGTFQMACLYTRFGKIIRMHELVNILPIIEHGNILTLVNPLEENLEDAQPAVAEDRPGPDDRDVEAPRRELRASPSRYSAWHGDELRSSRDLFWVTDMPELDRRLERSRNGATASRDLLGLTHFRKNMDVVLLELPDDAVSRPMTPTFIDGAPGPAFCLWRGGKSGFTWRLDTQQRGLREAVSRPVPLGDRVRVRLLGRIGNQPTLDYSKMLSRRV